MSGTERGDAGWALALAVAIIGWFLGLFVLHGLRFPVGPDAPVYLWWTRLSGSEGLSAVGHRPGVPALTLVLEGTLHVSVVSALAALECAVPVALGLSAAALVRSSDGGRPAWALAGAFAGTFAVHVAAGYVSTLVFAALFVGGAVLLCGPGRRATVGAGALLAAGGLAHPIFFLLGLGILAVSAALAWRSDARAEARRVGAVGLGAGAVVGVGLLSLLVGPGILSVDTSRDGFLRRAGLGDVLASAYRSRFVHRWTRYVEWASVPLAVLGLRSAGGFAGRFLRAWGLVTVLGVAVAFASGLAPADRFITFGFVVPILAALGLVEVWRWLSRRRAVAFVATGALTVAMLAGSLIAWGREDPFLSTDEVRAVDAAARYAAGARPGGALVFFVNEASPTVTFLATRAANVIRAGMPPDRIRDVVIKVPPLPPFVGRERDVLARVTDEDVIAATRAHPGRTVTFFLAPFDRIDRPAGQAPVARGVFVLPSAVKPGPASEPLEPSSPGRIAVATFAVLALLTTGGYGWARAMALDGWTSATLAPAFGTAALILGGIALERLGLPLTGSVGPTVVSALAGGGGYLAWLFGERRLRPEPPPEVEEQPAKQ
jgi:hypothetical protein